MEQLAEPAEENVPAPQVLQPDDLAADHKPAAQFVHELDPAAEYRPA